MEFRGSSHLFIFERPLVCLSLGWIIFSVLTIKVSFLSVAFNLSTDPSHSVSWAMAVVRMVISAVKRGFHSSQGFT